MSDAIAYARSLNDAAMALYKSSSPPVPAILTMLMRAISLAPEEDFLWTNLGLLHWQHGSIDVAKDSFERALNLNTSDPANHKSLSLFHLSIGEYEQAENYSKEAVSLSTDNPDLRLDAAHISLAKGDWKRGFSEYSARFESKIYQYAQLPYEQWNVLDDLNNKTLYVQSEQGVGDHILFSRYLSWLNQKFPLCRIILGIDAKLIDLFWEFRNFVSFVPYGAPWSEGVDYGTHLANLAGFYGTTPSTIPEDKGLIARRIWSDGRQCDLRQSVFPALKVAICWSGGQTPNNVLRSIPFPEILRLAEDPRISLYSVQADPGRADIERHGAKDIVIDIGETTVPQGWVATGLALREFDVVVTVCTGVAHLAGALGVNCWTLLSQEPYWIWQGSWYPSMRFFRQKKLGDWSGVISDVREALSVLAYERGI